MWHGRFREDTAEVVQEFTQSLDMDWRLAKYDIYGSIAHARMLGEVGIITKEESKLLEEGLRQVLKEIQEGTFSPKLSLEDVHMNIEARLTELIGPVGAKLHTGRSRNDQSATTVRLFLRKEMVDVGDGLLTLMDALIDRATAHRTVIVPGYTHLQQAQPISMGHYWLSHFWAFSRDFRRVLFALDSIDECPLGAGALAGSTLPLDREHTARLLGFKKPTDNSLDSVGHRDHMLDCQYALAVVMLHVSRLSEDLVIYGSREFGWLDLPDSFCTGSSMMPQKKNPDVLELARGRTGGVYGDLINLAVTMKALPSTYNRDMQEDKRPLWNSLQVVKDVLEVLPLLISRVEIDQEKALESFREGFALATDVAEYLVLKGVPFREAHAKVGKAVRWCIDNYKDLEELSLEEWKELIPEVEEDLLELMSLEQSVNRRETYGGTSFKQVALQIERGVKLLEEYRERLALYPAKFSL
ncbi:argininosuccinate lyase [Thermovirga lienii DSM 17291]|uniref:Argininosuccinate lyase n=1 Tax=Thermovirga lienii (strain ATCC BAA-1197 / DSM 17291 / Cas60314) TaxID=580340 RepID=G7V8B3_THELD|nr:argininosuccinate lyase [Thermovirga lienii]AER66275.1 argininosuccinate lyase [Thermovirga lienii DSM 17291]